MSIAPEDFANESREVHGSNDYNAFFRFDTGLDHIDRIMEQLSTWLRNKKGIDVDIGNDLVELFGRRDLSAIHRRTVDSHSVRVLLVEPTASGIWRTDVVVHGSSREPGWMRVSVTNDRGRFVDVPNLSAYVMGVVASMDGSTALTPTPRVIRGTDAQDFLELVSDPERTALVFAAGSYDDVPFDSWVDQVGRWTRQVRGLAHVVVLDPLATREYAELVGPSHAVKPGTIRTFIPGANPDDEADGLRHRYLGVRRLLDQTSRHTTRMLGQIARDAAAKRPQPAEVIRVERDMRRVGDRFLISLMTDKPAKTETGEQTKDATTRAEPTFGVSLDSRPQGDLNSDVDVAQLQPQVDAYLAQIELTKNVLGVTELNAEALEQIAREAKQANVNAKSIDRITRKLEEYGNQVAKLESELSAARKQYGELEELLVDEQLNRAVAEEEADRLASEQRYLRQKLRSAQDYETANSLVPEEVRDAHPDSFEELMTWLSDMDVQESGIEFTGDERKAIDLDEVDDLKAGVRTCWQAVLVLRDYVRARRESAFDAGLHNYLEQTPFGFRSLPRGKFAARETGRTMRDFGAERRFQVPSHVNALGVEEMQAHFKLASIGMVSPRMYVLDRYATDGVVYIGYIGRHLTNTMTN